MFPLAGYLLLGQNATSLFCFWLRGCVGRGRGSPNVSEGGRAQQFGGVFILICDFQPLLDIGNSLQLPAALNVKLLSITIFFSCLLPPPPPGHRSGYGAVDLVCHSGPASSRDRTQDCLLLCCWILHYIPDYFPFTRFYVGLILRFYNELGSRKQ